MSDLHSWGFKLKRFLYKPQKVLVVCILFFFVSLLLNGALWRVWNLRRDLSTIENEIKATQKQSAFLDMQIKQAKDPVFIERQARDKLDMVSEKDLLFVFPE